MGLRSILVGSPSHITHQFLNHHYPLQAYKSRLNSHGWGESNVMLFLWYFGLSHSIELEGASWRCRGQDVGFVREHINTKAYVVNSLLNLVPFPYTCYVIILHAIVRFLSHWHRSIDDVLVSFISCVFDVFMQVFPWRHFFIREEPYHSIKDYIPGVYSF